MELRKGIDISVWNKNIDWDKLKGQIDFAILRIGYTGYGKTKNKKMDSTFEEKYAKCKELGIPVGVYWYSCAVTEEEAIEEANKTIEILKGRKLEYPIYFDTEDNHDTTAPNNSPTSQAKIGRAKLTKVTKAFCDTIEKAGYYVGIYASSSWFKNNLNLNELEKYDKWVAQWSNNAPSGISYGMWQYSAKGYIDGIGGGVDLDYAYKDYPTLMQEQGLNGYSKEEEPSKPALKPIEEVAQEVIDMKWDVYPKRKELLEEAGYNYEQVQNKVNEILKSKESTYTVQKGDYLIKIGKKIGVSWLAIAKLNNIKFPYIIRTGQVLRMPK